MLFLEGYNESSVWTHKTFECPEWDHEWDHELHRPENNARIYLIIHESISTISHLKFMEQGI